MNCLSKCCIMRLYNNRVPGLPVLYLIILTFSKHLKNLTTLWPNNTFFQQLLHSFSATKF